MRQKLETWKPIPGYDGYEVSDLGRVRSVDRVVEQISPWGKMMKRRLRSVVLKPGKHPDGHLLVNLWPNGTRFIHKLVLLTFVGEPPFGWETCHNDGDPENNNLLNLRYDTHMANEADKLKHGTHIRGERHGAARLTEKDIHEIRASTLTGVTLAQQFKISETHVCNIRSGKAWGWLNG